MGGAARLLQLIDRDSTDDLASTTCQDFLDDVTAEGFAEVNSYISPAVDLGDPALQTAPLLVRYELALDVYLVWQRGTSAMAMPEEVRAQREDAIRELEKIGERRKGLGLVVKPTASQPITQLTKTDDEPYFSPAGPRRRFDGWS